MTMLRVGEVAARLGVKVDTVYAYVSRGVLASHREPGARYSVFDSAEVEKLALRGRPRRTTIPLVLDLVVETGLTTIVDHRIHYRGLDACVMARTHTFEQAAVWLWLGDDVPVTLPWEAYPVSLPDLDRARDRIRAAVVSASACEPMRADLGAPAVTVAARALIATMVDAVPAASDVRAARLVLDGEEPPVRGSVAGRLWSRLATGRTSPSLVAALNAALVLLADHELAPSTVAARVAASVRADPFSVVLAGLGPIAGRLHGSASTPVHRLLMDALSRGPEPALCAAIDANGFVPGFLGHRLYPDGDPRATLLLAMVGAAAPGAPVVRMGQTLIELARRRTGTRPNVDFALGVLSAVARMPETAGETIFTIARTAGWIAHGIEEYTEPPLRFRARAIARVMPTR
jgi:citrate synthase